MHRTPLQPRRSSYLNFWKPLFDKIAAFLLLIPALPVLLVLALAGWVAFRGENPFFVQLRPGYLERPFRMLKLRTMRTLHDPRTGLPLPDAYRLTGYGQWLRATSLDELPQLIHVLLGQMSIVGPRPLLMQYLPLYSEEQRLRHLVKPGITGMAQVAGRNALDWPTRLALDAQYAQEVSPSLDVRILFITVIMVLLRKGITAEEHVTVEPFQGNGPVGTDPQQVKTS